MIKWNFEYKCSIFDIDENHEKLFKLLNKACQLFINGINIDENKMDELYNHMILCFDCEEKWMVNVLYPDFSLHIAVHEQFIVRFFEIRHHY